jgi:hypothetical protein
MRPTLVHIAKRLVKAIGSPKLMKIIDRSTWKDVPKIGPNQLKRALKPVGNIE